MTVRLSIVAAIGLAAANPAAAAGSADAEAAQASAAITKALDDPRTEQTIGAAMRALTDTLLDMKVGELKAVIDGRTVSDADKKLTVRDLVRRNDPNGEGRLRQQIEQARPMIRKQAKALASKIPELTKNAEALGRSMERVGANIPDPTYPKR